MPKNNELGLTGPGVETVEIPEIEKAIAKYQRLKDARCQASPPEVAAKTTLRTLLHQHREELPADAQGTRFYRSDGRDYVLLETLKVLKVESDDDDEDDIY